MILKKLSRVRPFGVSCESCILPGLLTQASSRRWSPLLGKEPIFTGFQCPDSQTRDVCVFLHNHNHYLLICVLEKRKVNPS